MICTTNGNIKYKWPSEVIYGLMSLGEYINGEAEACENESTSLNRLEQAASLLLPRMKRPRR